jgi:hypothetical protein
VVRTLQSIKKGIALLDERRASLEVLETRPTDDDGFEDRWQDEAGERSPAQR